VRKSLVNCRLRWEFLSGKSDGKHLPSRHFGGGSDISDNRQREYSDYEEHNICMETVRYILNVRGSTRLGAPNPQFEVGCDLWSAKSLRNQIPRSWKTCWVGSCALSAQQVRPKYRRCSEMSP